MQSTVGSFFLHSRSHDEMLKCFGFISTYLEFYKRRKKNPRKSTKQELVVDKSAVEMSCMIFYGWSQTLA